MEVSYINQILLLMACSLCCNQAKERGEEIYGSRGGMEVNKDLKFHKATA